MQITNKPELHLNLKDFLIHFLNNNNIPRRSANSLLQYMKHNLDSSLPLDTRSLMRTPRSPKVISVNPGKYIHISLSQYLKCFSKFVKLPSIVKITIFVDGFEVSRSSKKGLWIILAKFHDEINIQKPCIVGIYCGKKRPISSNSFLTPLVNDLEALNIGIVISGELIKLSVDKYVVDSPARFFITGTRGQNSNF